MHAEAPTPVVVAAFAIPTEVLQSSGLRIDRDDGESALAVFLARIAALCGVQPVDDARVVVPRHAIPDAVLDATRIDDALSREPLLLRRGDAQRLGDLRQRVLADEAALAHLREKVRAGEQQLETLSQHLREMGTRAHTAEAERNLWKQVAERRIGVQARALLRRLLERLESR
jgi:hypothetical protein